MGSARMGSDQLDAIYVGESKLRSVRAGSSLVWKAPSQFWKHEEVSDVINLVNGPVVTSNTITMDSSRVTSEHESCTSVELIPLTPGVYYRVTGNFSGWPNSVFWYVAIINSNGSYEKQLWNSLNHNGNINKTFRATTNGENQLRFFTWANSGGTRTGTFSNLELSLS
jgi:hypothetical protein